jgi:hypothetical protein
VRGYGRIPVELVDAAGAERRGHRTALVLTGAGFDPADHPLVRHAGSAAAAQHGACPCCRAPSGLAAVLRQLFLDRVHGRVPEFDRVLIAAGDEADVRAALDDPLVAARYVLCLGGAASDAP